MKYLAIALTIALGVYGTAASADTGSKHPILTLAMNNSTPEQWIDFPTDSIADTPANQMQREQAKKMEQLNVDLDKALEAKFSREFNAGI